MRRGTRVAGGVVAWACCVSGVAWGAWYAIDSAGRQVTLTSLPANPPGAGQAAPAPSATVDPATPATASPSTSATPTGPATSTSAPPARQTAAPNGPTGSRPLPSPSTQSTQPPPQPQPITGSVPTQGGTLELECTGTQVTDYSAQPADGWSGRVQRESSSTIRAVFTRNSSVITIYGSCSTGRPHFDVGDHWDE